ncbi:hypothetical protein EJ03DRAFT_324701 [Teratosphaeria nubilosa]|uniref:Uncharacterized protein n=1 Tax=Teratosphaeria nubilosa TaxID=161662 RepID=A0A6G1LHC5_9PEZI|nr:hypothetical protein EJ03DRAFT_324701 [Teratosphaeria nubilosa]
MSDGARKRASAEELTREKQRLSVRFKAQHALVVAFFLLIFLFHALGIYLFCSGFLLSRLVLPDRSECALLPIEPVRSRWDPPAYVPGSADRGCWHPKSFDRAIVIIVDALRYDFTVPFQAKPGDEEPHHFHNALPVLYETALQQPRHAFLRPFIADPPTTTLQRLKGLTTGTLPTFIDAGSNFAGTAIDEDNLVEQLFKADKKVVHLGDDTWHSLFPGYFEPNLTKPYDSFNVWDLHTVDNGVNEHLFPLLEPNMHGRWDVIVGHYLGVDHAGHRYGPDHPAMTDKLKQMDDVFRRIIEKLDDKTLLVAMGDHGMDVKGDHGGESDDEVQAALWMYSKKGTFGRHPNKPKEPPLTAKERPVGQIDLVPTLAFLLGMPVPFNNLGQPIEDAFLGEKTDFANLAEVNRLTAAQIHRYQEKYNKARGLDESATSSTSRAWDWASKAYGVFKKSQGADESAQVSGEAFLQYMEENLNICKRLWARFDLVSMGMGITVLIGAFAILAMYAHGLNANRASLTPPLLAWGGAGTAIGGVVGACVNLVANQEWLQGLAFGAAAGGIMAVMAGFWPARHVLRVPYPRTFWGGLCALVTLLLCIGFAANSFTIWEDEQLLFILQTFGILMLGSSLGQQQYEDRAFGAANAISFIVATRLSSLSRLCREEQMPNCRSTYYASATSSTSAGWQLAIPALVAVTLPSAMSYFFKRTKNYHLSAVVWIRYALRISLAFVAVFWLLDAADDGEWFAGRDIAGYNISKDLLKTVRVLIAQVTLAIAFAAGGATYILAGPMISVKEEEAPDPTTTKPTLPPSQPTDPSNPPSNIFTPLPTPPRKKLLIYGYANTHGTRYLLLPLTLLPALLLLQKPMGQYPLALCTLSILNLLELLDANDLRHTALGPTLLALLASFHFFKTGHQAALATIQWEAAFIPLKSLTYPWSPLLVVLNTYAPHILCALAVPALTLWKVPPKSPLLLSRVAGAMAMHCLVYAAIALATVVEAAWLRRHLMLYRVFMPRMLVGVTTVLLVEVVGAVVAVGGVRWSVASVGRVFGWAGT